MATLFNVDNQSFLDFIEYHTRKLSKINSYRFYAMTCYFKQDATEQLAESIHAILGNSLCEFHLLIDINEYCEELLDIDSFIADLEKKTRLSSKNISITPISPSPKPLFHAKGYALINCDHRSEAYYQGFGIITSANLTNGGIYKNIEIGHIFDDNNSLRDFYNIFMNLKNNYSITEQELEERLQKQRKSQKVVNLLLSIGRFYHKWEQEHIIDLRFPIKLSQKAKKTRKNKANEIDIKLNNLGYKLDKEENPSKKPIDIEDFFKLFPKPIPDNPSILGICNIDTLLGKWIPNQVSDLIERELLLSTDVYIKILQEHLQKNMSNYEKELKSNIKELEIDEIIDSNDGDHTKAISKWKERIVKISQDENLLKLLLWKYEQIPISLNSIQDPNLILTRLHNLILTRLHNLYQPNINRKGVGKIFSDNSKNNYEAINSDSFNGIYIEVQEKFIINRLGDVYKLITSTLYLLYFTTKFNFSELYCLIKFYLFLSNREKYFCAIVKPNKQTISGVFIRLENALKQQEYLDLGKISGQLIYKTEASKEEKTLLLENLVTFKIVENKDKEILRKFDLI
jgi:hypothetical protein